MAAIGEMHVGLVKRSIETGAAYDCTWAMRKDSLDVYAVTELRRIVKAEFPEVSIETITDPTVGRLPGPSKKTYWSVCYRKWGRQYFDIPLHLLNDEEAFIAHVRESNFLSEYDQPTGTARSYGSAVVEAEVEVQSQLWDDIETVIGLSRRVLLWGPPGTGKTYAASKHGVNGRNVYSYTLTEDTSMMELRGMFMPNEGGTLSWNDGPSVAAWRDGGRFVANEIDHASMDCLSFLHVILDDPEFARLTLPKSPKEDVCPAPGFDVVATMNGHPDDLPDALSDRFPVQIKVDEVHPKALSVLSKHLRPLAAKSVVAPKAERIGIRKWMEFDSLTAKHNVDVDVAARSVFGGVSREFVKAIKIASLDKVMA